MAATPTYANGTRRFPRLKMDLTVKVRYQQNGEYVHGRGRGNDLGGGGLALYLPAELPVGSKVEVELMLPYSRFVLQAETEVRNRDGYRYGLMFLKLTPLQAGEVERCCGALMLVQ